jgi:type III secretion system FlhB-like substrate exporter
MANTEWLDGMLDPKISKEAAYSQGTDAADHTERKLAASNWIEGVSALDVDAVEAEYQAKLAEEAKLLGKTAAIARKCPKCNEDIWDVDGGGMTGAKLNKCWNCGTAFDSPEESEIEAAKTEFVKCPNCDSIAARKVGDRVTCVTCDYDSEKKVASKKTAAYAQGETPKETIKKDYERDIKILSDYALAEMLAELRCSKAQNTQEMFAEAKEKAKKEVSSSREKAEKALLELTPDHTMLDWQKAFDHFSKDAKPEEVKEKDLYKPEVPEKEYDMDSPKEDKFKLPTKEEMVPAGNGREADERQEVTKQAVPVIKEAALEKKAEIFRQSVLTKGGNTLSFFYNPDNNLLVVDLIAANEEGGNELVRQTIDESSMLEHTASKEVTIEPVSPLKREEVPPVPASCEGCPVCGGEGTDLKNNEKDHISCMACGITYGEAVPEIQSQASKSDVIKKIAEIQSPWSVEKLADGTEAIIRREIVSTEEKDLTKESEEKKDEEIQKK